MFHKIACKAQHASNGIPAVNALLLETNCVVVKEPYMVLIIRNSALLQSIQSFQMLVQEAHKGPTKCSQLVTGDPNLVGIMGATK